MTRYAAVVNLDREVQDPPRIRICDTFASRLRGFMFRGAPSREEGLLLLGARDSRWDSAIHMFFVPFDLAIFWIDTRMQIVDRVVARAWHPAYVPARPARYVLEIHPDRYPAYEVGNKVKIVNV